MPVVFIAEVTSKHEKEDENYCGRWELTWMLRLTMHDGRMRHISNCYTLTTKECYVAVRRVRLSLSLVRGNENANICACASSDRI